MKDAMKWLLILGGGAYLFLHKQIAAAVASDPAAAAAAPAAAAPAAAAPAAAAPAPVTTDATGTKARMLAAAVAEGQYTANGGRLNANQWNYFYSTAGRGVPAPAPQDLGITDPAMMLTLDEYWTVATAHGLAGLGRTRSRTARAWEA